MTYCCGESEWGVGVVGKRRREAAGEIKKRGEAKSDFGGTIESCCTSPLQITFKGSHLIQAMKNFYRVWSLDGLWIFFLRSVENQPTM